jgi:hypothetical protein
LDSLVFQEARRRIEGVRDDTSHGGSYTVSRDSRATKSVCNASTSAATDRISDSIPSAITDPRNSKGHAWQDSISAPDPHPGASAAWRSI